MSQIVHIKDNQDLANVKLDFVKQTNRFFELFQSVKFPVTLYVEQYYSDRDFKDIYYHFLSSKYQSIQKFTQRIAIFERYIDEASFYSKSFNLEEKFVGVVTIRPLLSGSVGKTLFNVSKLKNRNISIRVAKFDIVVCGRKINFESFPFSSQDSEYMTCAETSLWSILQFYGTRYKEYRVALPSEIIKNIDDNHFQRVLPSTGLNYIQSSKVLKDFGFSSKVYYKKIDNESFYDDNEFRRIFYYYVASGIPFMTGIRLIDKNNKESGHAVVCVGHGEQTLSDSVDSNKIGFFNVVNSASYYNDFIFMDDNHYPFESVEFDKFNYKNYQHTETKYIIVPMYSRIFLDAVSAERSFYDILGHKIFGLENFKEQINSNDVVVRIFLTTSRNYKMHKFENDNQVFKIVDQLPMPKFLWVCEISEKGSYQQSNTNGEVVLDATASKNNTLEQILLIRYPNKFAFKSFDEDIDKLKSRFEKSYPSLSKSYRQFSKNLKGV